MNAIELMMEEHKNIKRMLVVVRKACFKLLKDNEINYEDFYMMIDFIRNYADAHHHKKEEIFLFNKMIDELGAIGEKTIKNGMLVEHDLGRFYISELKVALESFKGGNSEAILDIVANAISYTNHLGRHIDKEDKVIYKFAMRELKSETLEKVDQECSDFEGTSSDIREKYKGILKELEEKYL